MDGLLSIVTKLCPSRCYLTFFHFPERSIALETTGWFTKGLKLIPTAPNNVTQGSTRILYIDGLLSVANCA
jgi:hypothetical protein